VTALVPGRADLLYAGDTGGSVILWDLRAEKEQATVLNGAAGPRRTAIDALELHPDGEWLYAIHDNRDHLISFTFKQNFGYLGNGRGGAKFFGNLPDGRALITGDRADAGRIVFVSQAFPKNTAAVPDDLKHKADVQLVAAAGSGLVVTVTADATVHAWEVDRPKQLWSTTVEKLDPAAVAVSSDGTGIAVASKNGTVRVFDPKTGKVVHKLMGHDGPVHALGFNGNGKTLATAGADKLVRVWNPVTGKETAVLKGHTDAVRCLHVDSNGTVLISGAADKTIRVWELKLR
jgi:WD40 repeat protein